MIGEKGVGKKEIEEGMEMRIVNGEVKEQMKEKKLMEIEMGEMIEGEKYRGELEERMKEVIQEVKKDEGKIIILIEEMKKLVGEGKKDGEMDEQKILKNDMERGELN